MKAIAALFLSTTVLSGCATGYSLVRPYVHNRWAAGGVVRTHFLSASDPDLILTTASAYCSEIGYGKAVMGEQGQVGEFRTDSFTCEKSEGQVAEQKRAEEEKQRRARQLAEQERQLDEELAQTRTRAASNASYDCRGDDQCKRAFATAQIFIVRNSDMKIQVSTDTVVETFNPTSPGQIGMRVIKAPVERDSYRISVEVLCHEGCSVRDVERKRITLRALKAQSTFRPFMAENVR